MEIKSSIIESKTLQSLNNSISNNECLLGNKNTLLDKINDLQSTNKTLKGEIE